MGVVIKHPTVTLSTLSPSLIHFSLLVVVAVAVAVFVMSPVSATDHIVGANKGWNPGLNYTVWANNQTFYVGDYISFRYKKLEHNVYEVNKTGYDKCTTEGATGNWSNGKDFIQLHKPGRYYFICGTGGCSTGMKVSIVVHPLPPPPSASITATKHSSESSKHQESAAAAAALLSSGQFLLVVLRVLLLGFVSSVFMG